MLKCDHTNVNSRRAFPLNSRTSWVEQQHYKGSVVYRDNLVLGPAEYSPTTRHNARHVGTPTLSQRSRVSLVDAFNPFSSQLSVATPGRGGGCGHNSYSIVDDALLLPGQTFYDKSEAATRFHDHDRRMGTDPHRRFCPTPGASLTHDSLLLTRSVSGISTPARVHFGPDDIPFGDRAVVKASGPSYSPDYDSKCISKYVKLSKISPSARKTFADLDQLQALKRDQPESLVIAKLRSDAHASSPPSPLAVLRPKPSPVRMPILRTRKPPALSFDHSCYRAKALYKEVLELNPAAIDRLAKVGLFNSIMATKRQYDSSPLPNKISAKIRRSAL